MIRRRSSLKRRTPMPRMSAKRKSERRVYIVRLIKYLDAHPTCQRCNQAPSHDVHHIAGRLGGNYLDTTTWMALCRPCHDWIHEHPSVARAKKLLK